jgi:ATP-dependent Clp protease ATP-binding subunit ClpA
VYKRQDTARTWLAKTGYDPAFGARPLNRALQKHVESPLSVELLSGRFTEGDTVVVDTNEAGDGLTFRGEHPLPVEDIKKTESKVD